MKVSEITIEDISSQCRLDKDDLDEAETSHLEALKTAAVQYAVSFTGLSPEELDAYEDITVAVLTLITDMYDNRLMYADKNYANKTVETILNLHCTNFIPKEGTI